MGKQIADGAALWTKPKSEISPEDYDDYRGVAGQFDAPALTLHYGAERLDRRRHTLNDFETWSRLVGSLDLNPE